MSLYKDCDDNYKKLAQFESAMFLDLRFKPTYFSNLLDLNEDFDINYRIPETEFIKSKRPDLIGKTLLNITMDMLQDQIFLILLKRGADFTKICHNGKTIVHESLYDVFSKLLSYAKSGGSIDEDDFPEKSLSAHVDRDISKNPRDIRGVTHFHVACMINHKEAVEYFLKNQVVVNEAMDFDSPEYPGFTDWHFAATYASYEAAKMLLNHGADMHLKDAKGMNPLHILVEERLRTFPAAFRTDKSEYWNAKESINNYFHQNGKMLKLFLKNIGNTVDDIGLSNLHGACTLKDISAVQQLLSESNVNVNLQIHSDSIIRPGYTALHFAAAVCDEETFTFLLAKGANMEMKDVHGVSPFDLCLLQFKISSIHSILTHHPTWKTILFSDGKTKLLDFIRAMQTSKEFQLFLREKVKNINMFFPLDSPICAGYTPLHLCVICSEKPPNYNKSEDDGYPTKNLVSYNSNKTSLYGIRIKHCLDEDADISTQDTRGSSPLHWAFYLQETSLVDLLLSYHKKFDNPKNDDGLSYLHIASALENELVVLKLLLNDRADLNSQTRISYSWYSVNRKRFVVESGSTPLHFAVIARSLMVTEILLKYNADVLAVDHNNFNPLERLLGARLDVDSQPQPFYQKSYDRVECLILEMLIGQLSRVLVDSADTSKILLCYYKLIPTDTLMSILRSEDKLRDKILNKMGLTKLHLACLTNDINAVQELLLSEDVDINAEVDEKSPIWGGMTPLCCYIDGRRLRDDKRRNFSLAKMLLGRGANVMRIRSGSSVIHEAFDIHCKQQMTFEVEVPRKDGRDDLGFVKLLLSYHRDFSVNPTANSGLSHFHIACACNNHEMVVEFLKNGQNVNQKIDYFCQQYGGDTPLHIAAIYKSKETVDILLKHGADVHSTNSYNGTPLHVATQTCYENLYIMKALLRAGSKANAESIKGAMPVELLMVYRNPTAEEIDICLKNSLKIDVFNPVTGQGCLGRALEEQQYLEFIYNMFVESTDLTKSDKRNRNAIHNVVSVLRPDLEELDKRVIIDEAFIPVDDYTKAIEGLIKLNLDIDQQDTQGRTPLHYATLMQNVTAILGLLKNGADVNILDESGKTAFTHCLEYDKESFDHHHKVDKRILQIFISHSIKLFWLDQKVDASIRTILEENPDEHREIIFLTAQNCRDELSKLRVEPIISSSITLTEFLFETRAIFYLSSMPLNRKDALKKYFDEKNDYLRHNYPEFVSIIMLQYNKALKRMSMIPLALDSVSVLVGFRMPYLCSDIIVQYLSNDNLKNLIAAACL